LFLHSFSHNPQQKLDISKAVTSFPATNTKTPRLFQFVDKFFAQCAKKECNRESHACSGIPLNDLTLEPLGK